MVSNYAASLDGIHSLLVKVEVKISPGIKYFLVGLPDSTIKEGYYRIESALDSCKIRIPRKKIIVNLSPADLKKEGSLYDLTIATGILTASNILPYEKTQDYIILGELALNGDVLPIRGALSAAILALKNKFKGIILPYANLKECTLIDNIEIIGVNHLNDLISFFSSEIKPKYFINNNKKDFNLGKSNQYLDMSDVLGQSFAKRAMCIAAAGSHNIILVGPPGSGKSMLSKRLPSILPPLNKDECIESTQIYSAAGKLGNAIGIYESPFRSPHHSISDIALIGGGLYPKPGEISLAHNGVLFMDELLEFKSSVLQVLRQPLEDGCININRSKKSVEFPADFMLVGAMNPCPCGYLTHSDKECKCSPYMINKYQNKLSGPLLDRIDIQIYLTELSMRNLSKQKSNITSKELRSKVVNARKIQNKRFFEQNKFTNSQMTQNDIYKFCSLEKKEMSWFNKSLQNLGISARSYFNILKVSRTIADIENSNKIKLPHLAEAIQLRGIDRKKNFY